MKRMKKKKLTAGVAVNYILITLLTFICLYPFLNVIAYSFSGYNAVLSKSVTFFPKEFTLEAYKQILGRTTIWTAMRTTVIITVLGTALSLVLTTFAAYALSIHDLPGRKAGKQMLHRSACLSRTRSGDGLAACRCVCARRRRTDGLRLFFTSEAV